jgi:hypothetical protein
MITDDPGTPGDNHYEINVAWTDTRTPGSTLEGLPLLDANYGIGDRIQLNYQASRDLARGANEADQDGLSDSQIAVKWRFYDAGDAGLQVSTYPRFTFPNPGSDTGRRETADPETTFLLPFEVRRNFGALAVNADIGYTFSNGASDRGWMGGACVGHNISRAWELDAELHATGSDGLQRTEFILDAGTRFDFSESSTLLLAIGRDVHNSLGPRASLLTYVGIQVRL